MKLLIFFLVPTWLMASITPQEFLIRDSKIKDVTVYSDRALVTREISGINAPWIKIEALSNALDKNSIKIKAIGVDSKAIKQIIIGDSFYQNTLPSDVDQKLKELKSLYLKKLNHQLELSLMGEESNFLKQLGFESPYSASSDNFLIFQAKTSIMSQAIDQITNSEMSLFLKIQEIEENIKNISDEIRVLKSKLLSSDERRSQKWLTDIYLNVDNKKFPKDSRIEISYFINNSHWLPQYDVRCNMDMQNGKVDINLVSFGKIENKTGEDWEDVNITLSSIDPVPLFLPRLNRWLFSEKREEVPQEKEGFFGNLAADVMDSVAAPQAKRMAKMKSSRARADKMAGMAAPMNESIAQAPGGFAAVEEDMAMPRKLGKGRVRGNQVYKQNYNQVFTTKSLPDIFQDLQRNLNLVEATRSGETQFRVWNGGNNYQKPQKRYLNGNLPASQANGRKLEFKSPFSFSLKSHEEPMRIPTTTTELRGDLTYLLIPKKDKKAYLRTKVVNNSKQPILGGAANIYLDGDLTSKSNIVTTNEKAFMTFDLGVDELIESKRVVKKESIKEGVIFKKHQVEITVELEVVNNHNFPIDIELKDNYPQSPSKEIEIELGKISPKPIQKKYGIITWNAKVPASSKEKFRFTYKVTHPENFIIRDYDL